jgi:hypothetical protein
VAVLHRWRNDVECGYDGYADHDHDGQHHEHEHLADGIVDEQRL